ncbi:hypothetical protein [Bradyrhizobium prioriisuperbiae]|uniref:hypothetical protein n=1 Tax=Bradyrhizobium prioriisuperbiae TaxID=2854389 RepID=UPI0028E3B3AC|nr:hypothetical protein [Bradyrhizobium prioritasuperba]
MLTRLTRRRALAVGAAGFTSVLLSAASAAKTGRGMIRGPIPNFETVTPLPPLKLAIPDFVATTPRLAQTALDISREIRLLLRASGPFHIVDTDEVNTRQVAFDDIPQPDDWRSLYVSVLVAGQVSEITDTRMGVAFRLWLVATRWQVTGQTYKADLDDWQRLARIIAGEIFERTNGDPS